ncbi:MAG TPA: hypothetical protein ENH52_08515 [Nitrospirae bacterium]|nr:hypothetical protein [Nitrospirota bacterium]
MEHFEKLKWLFVAIVLPLFAWLVKRIVATHNRKRRKETIIKHLCGLPSESKAILIDFYNKGTHTIRGDPYAPPIEVLVSQGIITRGPGGGSYNAVNRYLTIRPHIWEVMNDWVSIELINHAEIIE